MDLCWGIDLGGTKIEGIVFKRDAPHAPLCRLRIDTEADRGYEHIVSRVGVLVRKMKTETKLQPSKIGIGTPGVLDPHDRTMKNCNTTCLNGRMLDLDLTREVEAEVRLSNDANCFAIAEAVYGAGRGVKVVFGVIMGTGVGGGVVVDGKALYGCQGIAGEWGHNVIEPGGAQCYCGKRGCVETVISGPALERYYAERAGAKLSLEKIAEVASKDPVAKETIGRMCEYFGRALSVVVNIIDPDVVVLGGGVSNVSALYVNGVGYLAKYIFNNRLDTLVQKNELGDSAGVVGAALLF